MHRDMDHRPCRRSLATREGEQLVLNEDSSTVHRKGTVRKSATDKTKVKKSPCVSRSNVEYTRSLSCGEKLPTSYKSLLVDEESSFEATGESTLLALAGKPRE